MLSRRSTDYPLAHIALVILAALGWPAGPCAAQAITVHTTDGALHVRAPQARFIHGEPLARVTDGQSVRVDLDLTVLAEPGGSAVAQRRQSCVLSYDLWEERFAVTIPGMPARSISHLTAAAAEAWCLDQLAIPVSALGPLGQTQFWIRLEYRVPNNGNTAEPDEGGLTLKGLIDLLSRKPRRGDMAESIEAGPFRLRK